MHAVGAIHSSKLRKSLSFARSCSRFFQFRSDDPPFLLSHFAVAKRAYSPVTSHCFLRQSWHSGASQSTTFPLTAHSLSPDTLSSYSVKIIIKNNCTLRFASCNSLRLAHLLPHYRFACVICGAWETCFHSVALHASASFVASSLCYIWQAEYSVVSIPAMIPRGCQNCIDG